MSPNHRLRRVFPAFVLLAALVLASLPAGAQPTPRRLTNVCKVAALGEGTFAWIQNLLRRVWESGGTKEGMSIDPDGASGDEGVTIDPDGASSDEGMSIDPDGRN